MNFPDPSRPDPNRSIESEARFRMENYEADAQAAQFEREARRDRGPGPLRRFWRRLRGE